MGKDGYHNEKRTMDKLKGVKHMTTIQKWGNSLAVLIPTQVARDLGVENGSEVEVQLIGNEIVVKPVRQKPTLDELLEKAKGKTNPHLDYNFGQQEGKELI